MNSQYNIGQGEISLRVEDKILTANARTVTIDIEEDFGSVHSDIHAYPVSRFSMGQTITLLAEIIPDEQGRTMLITEKAPMKKSEDSAGRFYTTVPDLTVASITEAMEVVGASPNDVFEVEDHENGYKVTWEV